MVVVTETQRKAGVDWVYETQLKGDSLDPDAFMSRYTDDVHVNFGNSAPLVGVHTFKEWFAGQVGVIHTMKHEPVDIDVLPNKIVQSCKITYTFKGKEDEEIRVNGLAVWWKTPEEDKARRFDVYGDFEEVRTKGVQAAKRLGFV
ncbi:hypothetical protein BT69DRAFT_466421 [Atractiella rhizophila]|nr:hypothetical protein BT69DRAFT_466421 [Atractiella rhizophila]